MKVGGAKEKKAGITRSKTSNPIYWPFFGRRKDKDDAEKKKKEVRQSKKGLVQHKDLESTTTAKKKEKKSPEKRAGRRAAKGGFGRNTGRNFPLHGRKGRVFSSGCREGDFINTLERRQVDTSTRGKKSQLS